MPHLRLEVPVEWLTEKFRKATGFDARKILRQLVRDVRDLRIENPAIAARRKAIEVERGTEALKNNPVTDLEVRATASGHPILPELVPFINIANLKWGIIPVYHSGVGDVPDADVDYPSFGAEEFATDAPVKRFLHAFFLASDDKPGRTPKERVRAAHQLGDSLDDMLVQNGPIGVTVKLAEDFGLASVTVHLPQLDWERGYSTITDRKKTRADRETADQARVESHDRRASEAARPAPLRP